MKIIVVDRDKDKLFAMAKGLSNQPDTHFFHGDFGDVPDISGAAIVSPANSFGHMDGGIDLAYAQRWPGIEKAVMDKIAKSNPFGEQLVGTAIWVDVPNDPKYNMLIAAPTMRVPQKIPVINVYLATRAAAAVADWINVHTLVIPGMGTGAGRVHPEQAGWAMYKGIRDGLDEQFKPPIGPNWQGVAHAHMLIGEPIK